MTNNVIDCFSPGLNVGGTSFSGNISTVFFGGVLPLARAGRLPPIPAVSTAASAIAAPLANILRLLIFLLLPFPVLFFNLYNLSVADVKNPVRISCQMIVMGNHDKRFILFPDYLLHQFHHVLRRM